MKITILDQQHNLPLLIEPEEKGNLDVLLSWHKENKAFVEEQLLQYGARLFRGFGINTPLAFKRFVSSSQGDLLNYFDGNSPRTKLSDGVYTSTEYPAEYFISLHNELSYSHQWPSKLFFCCITPAAEGGETPIADSRAILKHLDPSIVELFTQKQIKYVRNLHGGQGLGPSWQNTFETTDQAKVEKYGVESGVGITWKENGGLVISEVRQAVISHPKTDEKVWFNQADQFHPSTLPQEVYDSLIVLYEGKEEELPQNVFFGDGTPIHQEMLDEVRQVVKEQMVLFKWQKGDLLMVDNVLVCHGRMPFKGARKILVAMR